MTDDRFERDLRQVLAEPASGPLPSTLGQWLGAMPDAEAVKGRTVFGRLLRREGRRGRRVHAVGGLGAAAAVVVAVVLGGGVLLGGLGGGGLGGGGGQAGGGGQRTGDPNAVRTSAPPEPTQEPSLYTWDSGVVSLSIHGGGIIASGRSFLVAPGAIDVHSDPGDATYQTLELTWQERGVEMRMNIYFAADATSWWASEVRTYNGAARGDWITYRGIMFRTPRGRPYTGDIALKSPDGANSVTFTGVRLEAFRPGLVRRDPVGCRPVVAPGAPVDDPLGPGSPLAGSGLDTMTPQAAAAWLNGHRYCVTWRFDYRTDAANSGYGEVWCVPPPDSQISHVLFADNGDLIVFTKPIGDPILPMRPQPAVGWGC